MKEKNGIKVADKSIRNVPIGIWQKFVGRCIGQGKTVTQGIIEALNLWMEAKNEQNKKSV